MTLTLNNLTKKFGTKTAVNSVSLELGTGIYGLLGANGAGKTTLIRCICDLYKIDEGSILYNNENIKILKEKYREAIGYLPQDFGCYPEYTAYNFLVYLATVKGIEKKKIKKIVLDLLNEVGLSDSKNKKLKTFSGGMLRRIGIAQALLNEPDILILDEPSAGLDPKERVRLRNILGKYSENHTIIISTHIVSDIEFIAKTIIILKDGNIIKIGDRDLLLKEIENLVWEGVVEHEMIEEFSFKYKISNIRNDGIKNMVKIISRDAPDSSFNIVNPTLDDLYLYLFEEVSKDESIA